jgi:dihydropteroate synthase
LPDGLTTLCSDSLALSDGRVIRLPAVMGVLNVTPDSFSDGGQFLDPDRAASHALAMEAAGAAIIDIGGESTRPIGAHEVTAQEELGRVIPVLERLRGRLTSPISIDTRKAAVANAALGLGAAIINDITAMSSDPAMAELVAERACPVVLMHMKGGPTDHIKFASYQNVIAEVLTYLQQRAQFAVRAGVARSRVILDPGIGFAKTAEQNLALLSSLERLCALGYPVLVGVSRKAFIRRISGDAREAVLFGTAAANAIAIAAGAAIIRVHEPGPALAVTKMAAAIAAARRRV